MEIIKINAETREHAVYTNRIIADFLVRHLEQYGDKIDDIEKCLDYVMDTTKGGNILVGVLDGAIVGSVILNNTGMQGYIPENILVYIAVDSQKRGKGIGKKLIEKAITITNGNIALHVEPENPALELYKKVGFTNKYLEMRLMR